MSVQLLCWRRHNGQWTKDSREKERSRSRRVMDVLHPEVDGGDRLWQVQHRRTAIRPGPTKKLQVDGTVRQRSGGQAEAWA